ncbi:MAG: hypothetical protein MRK02_17560 [Candidatus Scalindua sp.]|nr:hypothetical protein [Candidatus Scalindua sp.]
MKRFTIKQIEITMLITTGEKRYFITSGINVWLSIDYDKAGKYLLKYKNLFIKSQIILRIFCGDGNVGGGVQMIVTSWKLPA